MTSNNTIIALATGQGGAISTIRISGDDAISTTERLFRSISSKKLSENRGFSLSYGVLVDKEESKIDDVIISLFRAPKSYTGEDMIEISCHASDYIIGRIIEQFTSLGVNIASPGEFTQRAYLNGKMDMVQAEAVAELIASTNKASHTLALNQMRGGYTKEFTTLRDQLLTSMSLMELELDFSEEDVEFADRSTIKSQLNSILSKIESLIGSFRQGNAIKNGIPVAIVGAPNSGKSTLLNALLKEDRAIVSDIEGTTRDVIEECITIDGINYRFLDTAGIRETTDTIESIGIERALSSIDKAEVVIWLIDPSRQLSESETDTIICKSTGKSLIAAINKADLYDIDLSTIIPQIDHNNIDIIEISAKSGENLESLTQLLAKSTPKIDRDSVLITNQRHCALLERSKTSTQNALTALENSLPTDLIATDIRETIHHLGSITGEISTDDILHNIFRNFCIGK